MARPSNRSQRREELVSALLRVVARSGWADCTMVDIATEAGVSPSLLNYHFTSKSELLSALVQHLGERVSMRTTNRKANSRDPWTKLDALVDVCLGLGPDADPVALAAWNALGAESLRLPELRDGRTRALASLREALAEALAACAPGVDVEPLSFSLLAMIEGAWQVGGSAVPVWPQGVMAPLVRETAHTGLSVLSRRALREVLPSVAPFEVPDALVSLVDGLWSSPGRWYHDPLHLVSVLQGWDQQHRRSAWAHPCETFLALVFHDAVYVPGRSDNEALSADLAGAVVPSLVPAADTDRMASLILLTASHGSPPDPRDPDASLLLDLDLAVLGADEALYDRYAAGVAREYGHLPASAWAAGRAQFLDRMLALPRLFSTERFERRLGARARRNLTREFDTFRSPAIAE